MNDNLQNLKDALEHEIPEEETSIEEPSTQEEKQVDNSTQEVNPAEEEVKEPKPATESEETQLVEDEEGKKYIPEKRFKEIYAKAKENERRAKELEKVVAQQTKQTFAPPTESSKTDELEVELLFSKYPQFDPSHESYDSDIDELAADIYLAGKAKTKSEAARMALDKVKVLSSKSLPIKEEARNIKKMMAESVTGKGGSRAEVAPDTDKMTPDELESYLKSTGNWLN